MSEQIGTNAPRSLGDLVPRQEIKGTVKRLELYGAFVDIGIGQDALLHISQLGKTNVRNVEDVVKVGDEITAYVLKVDLEAKRVALSLMRPPALTWDEIREGMVLSGTVTRLESYGAFIDVGAERDAMVHVSELSSGYVNSPSDVVKVGDTVEGRVIKINRKKRQIDMSLKAAEAPKAAAVTTSSSDEDEGDLPTAMELALRRAMADKQPSRREKSRKRDKDRRYALEQEEILSRTLRDHSK
ncbi:MAG: 30S ribosomal protein S1 [Chloroflexi bacterium]|nr:30S ribosomal protein S1 [Chloroflexota bacterium]MDL1884157.1 30S ribosomal protein S1 [Anaerolineae bacterium CFX8]